MAPPGEESPVTEELQRLQAERDAALRRVQELSAAQETFLRAVSHDLRAPLRHVTSYAALLREVLQQQPDPTAQVREALGFAATMQQSARRMAAMLDGLQAMSRAGSAPLRLAAVDVGAVVLQECDALSGAQPVRWRVHGDIPPVRADAALFAQVVRELLANAIKFSHGCEAPSVEVSGAAVPNGRVRLGIADNGVGFAPEHAQGLFGVFQRLHRDGEFEGVGAGLALCKLIAERHGATIGASARPGRGCTITLDWPAAN
ncbi:MAG: two-component sensor histidine kinase [Comamonas sp.]|nr:two-component sensor histidine kinase [Comamonas sp.]